MSRIPRVLVGPLVCLALAVVGIGGYLAYRASTGNESPAAVDGAVTVDVAVTAPVDRRVAVTGFVFLDKYTGDLLCAERTKGPRPACKGVVATLEQLDPTRLDLVRPEQAAKGFDAWSRDAVVLQVRTRRATFIVEDVLPGPGSS